MELSIKSVNATEIVKDCVVVGIYENNHLTKSATDIDTASLGFISKIIENGDFEGKLATTLMLHYVPNISSKKILLVGLGKKKNLNIGEFVKAVVAATKVVAKNNTSSVGLYLTEAKVESKSLFWKVEQQIIHAISNTYVFNHPDCKKSNKASKLKAITLGGIEKSDFKDAEEALTQGTSIAHGINFTKELGNLPSNICTPTYLANTAISLATPQGIEVEVLGRKEIEELGMNSFLSVAKGSSEEPKFIILKYLKGKKKEKPIVLVGKGITFDTGGISIKPCGDMDEMKYDMCGAATVLGTLKAVAELGTEVNLIGIIPTCENMPSHNAVKPGDVVTSMSKQTIEILNTDAEGRLILCDALTYVERFEPKAVIDIATLTGACIVALGTHVSGIMGNNDELITDIIKAGNDVYDRAWQLPMFDEFQDQIKSNFADIANIGTKGGGTITAACFLSRFTKKYDWAHLDIAGTANIGGAEKGATGRPVNMLTHYVINTAK